MSVVELLSHELIAREYLRVSRDKSGRERSTNEQHDEHVDIADEQSWTLHPVPYADQTSASRYAQSTRGDFEQLMLDLRTDAPELPSGSAFGAHVLVLWESSRGSRKTGEWATMLDLLEERGILIWVSTHERLLNPTNMIDRKTLLMEAVDAEFESAKISKRARRAQAAQAKAGMPTGVCPLGYVRVYDRSSGRLVSQIADDSAEAIALDPERTRYAPMIRELFERIAKGHALVAIARDFERDGWRTPVRVVKKTGKLTGGTPYTAPHLRTIALTHAYSGQRVWVPGRKAGGGSHSVQIKPEHVLPGAWDGLVSVELFNRVSEKLRDPKRRTSRPGRANHLLSMIAVCDVCGGTLRGGKRRRSGVTYVCSAGSHVSINEGALDEKASELIVSYLASEKLADDLAARENRSHELSAVRDELSSIRAELDELAKSLGRNEISPRLAGIAEAEIEARLRKAERRERKLSTPSELLGLIEPGAGVEKRWESMPLAARRQVARLVLTPERLGELRVKRIGSDVGPVRIPARDRIELRRAPHAVAS